MHHVIIAVLILLLIALIAIHTIRYDRTLTGYHVGNAQFLKKAGLSQFELYISPSTNRVRKGYLIVVDEDGDIVANEAITIKNSTFWPALAQMFGETDRYKLQLEIESTLLPKQLTVAISIMNGTLTLFNDKKIYAYLERDTDASKVALRAAHGGADSPDIQ